MVDFDIAQGDTIQYPYEIPVPKLEFYTIYFQYSDNYGHEFKIKCFLNDGKIIIPFTQNETSVSGLFRGQFILIDSLKKQTTWPVGRYLQVMVHKMVIS